LSSTDALFTRFEELFRKYLDSKQFLFLTPEELAIEQDSLRALFYYSWDKGDPPSKQMLLEDLQITYPSGTPKFLGSPTAIESHVVESFALALEKLRFEEPKQDEEKTVSLPPHPQQKLKRGRKGDPRIQKRRDIVKIRIQEPKDFLDPEIQRELLDEFHKEEIPIPRQSVNIPASILEWPEFMGYPNRWRKFVESCLKKDLYR